MSVNEEDYLCWNLPSAGLRGRMRGRGVGLIECRMCCPSHTGNEVTCGVAALYNGFVEYVAMWVPCVNCGIWVASFPWPVNA